MNVVTPLASYLWEWLPRLDSSIILCPATGLEDFWLLPGASEKVTGSELLLHLKEQRAGTLWARYRKISGKCVCLLANKSL